MIWLQKVSDELFSTYESQVYDYKNDFILPYLDDLLVFSKKVSSYIKHLTIKDRRLEKHKFKIMAEKCKKFRRKARYWGRIVTGDWYWMDPNIKAVKDLLKKKAKTLGDARRLLEMVGYYTKYKPKSDKTADPL